MITSQHFNKTFFETAFKVSKNTFLPLLLIMAIFYAVLIAIMVPIFIYIFGIDFSFIQEYMNLGLLERNEFLESYLENNFLKGFDPENFSPDSFDPAKIMSFVGLGTILVFIMMILTSWYYYFIFLLNDSFIKTGAVNLKKYLSDSFSNKVFTVLLLSIFSGIIFIGLEVLLIGVIMALGIIHVSLAVIGGFIGFILLIAMFMRFILVMPHIVNTNDSAYESLVYSFKEVNFKAGLKYFAVIIVAYIVLMMASVMLMSMKILGGVAGMIILTLLQVVFSAFTTALATSSNLGLYYLYNPELIDDDIEIEDSNFENLELIAE